MTLFWHYLLPVPKLPQADLAMTDSCFQARSWHGAIVVAPPLRRGACRPEAGWRASRCCARVALPAATAVSCPAPPPCTAPGCATVTVLLQARCSTSLNCTRHRHAEITRIHCVICTYNIVNHVRHCIIPRLLSHIVYDIKGKPTMVYTTL